MIRISRSRDHCLAQARISVDHSLPPLTCQRIRREEHTCYRRFNHSLHHHRQLHTALVQPKILPITHRTIRPQRGPAASYRVQHRLNAYHIEIGILLPRETCKRQVLRRSRGAHSHRDRFSSAKNTISFSNSISNTGWHRCFQHASPSCLRQFLDIPGLPGSVSIQHRIQPCFRRHQFIRSRRYTESRRHGQPCARHFS